MRCLHVIFIYSIIVIGIVCVARVATQRMENNSIGQRQLTKCKITNKMQWTQWKGAAVLHVLFCVLHCEAKQRSKNQGAFQLCQWSKFNCLLYRNREGTLIPINITQYAYQKTLLAWNKDQPLNLVHRFQIEIDFLSSFHFGLAFRKLRSFATHTNEQRCGLKKFLLKECVNRC